MATDESASPELSAEQRERLRRAHLRLRNTSQALEALVATEPVRGRWAPQAPTPEALQGAATDLHRAYQALLRCHEELLGWPPPTG